MTVLSELFSAIVDLVMARNLHPLSQYNEPLHVPIDKSWNVWINGSRGVGKGGPQRDVEIPPFNAYIEFNGWPAGLVSPGGGAIAAGRAANEDTFIEACRKAMAEESK